MNNRKNLLQVIVGALLLSVFAIPKPVFAAYSPCTLDAKGVELVGGGLINEEFYEGDKTELSFKLNTSYLPVNQRAEVWITRSAPAGLGSQGELNELIKKIIIMDSSASPPIGPQSNFNLAWSKSDSEKLFKLDLDEASGSGGDRYINVAWGPFVVFPNSVGGDACSLGKYRILDRELTCDATITISQERTNADGEAQVCYGGSTNMCTQADTKSTVVVTGTATNDGVPLVGRTITAELVGVSEHTTTAGNDGKFSITAEDVQFGRGDGRVNIRVTDGAFFYTCKEISFPVGPHCSQCQTSPIEASSTNFSLCNQTTGAAQTECISCFQDGKAVWTAVGCIETEPKAIIESVIRIGIGIGGGLALLMTLIGGFVLTTSQGDPKRTQEGKDMVTSSVIGITFVLFSVVILQFIGVTILRLPGFGGT